MRAVLSGVNVVTLQPHTLEDVFSDMRRIAAALGVPGRGDSVVRQVRAACWLRRGLSAQTASA